MAKKLKIILYREGWENSVETINELYATPNDEIVEICTGKEGFSLKAYGVLQVLDQWVADTGRSPDTVIIDTPNWYEKIKYQYKKPLVQHFFLMYDHYFTPIRNLEKTDKLFGFFTGRYTPNRNMLAKDILTDYKDYFLMSVMRHSSYDNYWWDNEVYNVGSIDNQHQRNQYKPEHNTNLSLLNFYNQFEIELVSETFIYGETFFTTEKTIRPIVGCRPIIVNGPVNFLENLKKYGFKTFEQLWPEDYDKFEGPARWSKIKSTIDYIIEHGYDRKLAQEIVHYNYDRLQNLKNEMHRGLWTS
jgi:hypothetical protein